MSDVTFAGLRAKLIHACKRNTETVTYECIACYAERLEKRVEELREEVDTHVTSERIMSERLTALLGTSEAGKGEERG